MLVPGCYLGSRRDRLPGLPDNSQVRAKHHGSLVVLPCPLPKDGSGVSLAAARLPDLVGAAASPVGGSHSAQAGWGCPDALRILAWLSVKPLFILVPPISHYVLGELIMPLGKHYGTFMAALKLICH